MQKIPVLLLAVFIFFIFAQPVFSARSLSITSNKSALFGNEEMVLTASMSGFTSGETIYLKGSFYQDGGTNYFGYTKHADNWIKNGESTASQKQIKIGEWDGNLTVKTDFTDSGYKGEGSYKIKLGFYYLTSGGNLSSVNWSANSLDINISEPDPTALPTITSAPSLLPTTVKISPIPTIKPTATGFLSPSKSPTKNPDKKVLGVGSSSDRKKEIKNENSDLPVRDFTKKDQGGNSGGAWIALGAAMILISCAILAYLKIRSKKQKL